jgi:flavorubredoxin
MSRSDSRPLSNAVEIVPDRLYVVAGALPVDGRMSWTPPTATGEQSTNIYLLRGEHDVLVDTGIAAIREQVMAGLSELLEPEAPVRVFLTRAQLDCVGNLGAVASVYNVLDIFTGGARNPFDQFDAATSNDPRAQGIGIARTLDNPAVEIFNTSLRILATFWGYDAETRTAFTSDSFTHVPASDAANGVVLDDPGADKVAVEQVREHLFGAFWWLPFADKQAIAEHVRGFFATHPVDVIAPNRGCVLKGREIVDRHVEMLLSVLDEEPVSTGRN